MIDSELIDTSISMLNNNKSASSICSVWKAADDHPYRSMYINEDGFLESFQTFVGLLYFQLIERVISRIFMIKEYGFSVHPIYPYQNKVLLVDWLGSHPLPLEREWITGRDINGPFDVPFHTYWNHLRNTPETFTYS